MSKYEENLILTDESIPLGKSNAIHRQDLMDMFGLNYRELKKQLAMLSETCSICNNQDGKGYYRPVYCDMTDLRKYIKQETSKAEAIKKRIESSKRLLEFFESLKEDAEIK